MSMLFDQIRAAVATDHYILGLHASERLRQRGIPGWQVAAGLSHAKLLEDRPRDRPNPSVVAMQMLADGSTITVVWSWLRRSATAKLVTVYFTDLGNEGSRPAH